MKRLLSFVLTSLILSTLAVPAFAAEERQAEVYARAVRTTIGSVYSSSVEDGPVEITTDDDIAVTVEKAPDGAALLMVVPVPRTETAAWRWITVCLEDTGVPIHTFDIYFEDQDGNRIDANGAVVTIDCPHCSGTPMVCSLTTDGKVRVLTDSAHGTTVTFTTNGSTYYIMADKAPSPHPADPDSPQTGDDSGILLWSGLLMGSALSILLLLMGKRRKENEA